MQEWSLTGGEAVRTWHLPGGNQKSSALSEDGRWLFRIGDAGDGQLWDVTTEKLTASPKSKQAVTRAAVSADGRRLALLADNGSLRIWDVAGSQWAGDALRLGSAIRHIDLSPDGSQLVAASDSAVRVWDVRTGQSVTPPLRVGGPIAAAAFAAGGTQVVTMTRRGTVCVWDLPRPGEPGDDAGAEQRPVGEILELARMLACAASPANTGRRSTRRRSARVG